MNDILVTIWDGLPFVALLIGGGFCVFVFVSLYVMVIDKLLEKGHEWGVTFLIAIPLFLFISSLSYVLGQL
jgi:hypothetical protein